MIELIGFCAFLLIVVPLLVAFAPILACAILAGIFLKLCLMAPADEWKRLGKWVLGTTIGLSTVLLLVTYFCMDVQHRNNEAFAKRFDAEQAQLAAKWKAENQFIENDRARVARVLADLRDGKDQPKQISRPEYFQFTSADRSNGQ